MYRMTLPHRRTLSFVERPWVYPVQAEVPQAVERFVQLLESDVGDVLEIGCGCGIIALHLAAAGHRVTAVDILPAAVQLTHANARRNGLQITAHVSDLASTVSGTFDALVFNVPHSFARSVWGNFMQFLAAVLLPKPLLEYIGARWAGSLRRQEARTMFFKRLALDMARCVRERGLALFLLPQGDHALLSNLLKSDWQLEIDESLPAARGVRLVAYRKRGDGCVSQ